MLSFDMIHAAGRTLRDVARKTDIIVAPGLAPACDLRLKTENLQRTGAFKIRGAYNKIASLGEAERAKGVVACSAGNHAQGVALAASRFGVNATLFLPLAAPISKIEATRRYGADIRLSEGVYDDAYEEAVAHARDTGAAFIHPFDDECVIAGQATVGTEIMEQFPDVDAVVVPVGGGGLVSGVAFAVKALNPKCAVYGVQAAGADSMARSFRRKEPFCADAVSTFADGIAVKIPGKLTKALCDQYVDDVVTVSDDETAAAILSMMETQKLVSEGAGAVAVAAVMFGKIAVGGKKVCAVVSGGNIDVNILSRVINRGLLKAGRLTSLTIELTDKPGQLMAVSALIAKEGANVIRVHYTPGGENMDINGCFLNISMETRDRDHLERIKTALRGAGFTMC
ncbi:MAG: threonine ammonia-lyase [Oscillospiraceae bacterium]|jgi:threonine dehydratase|nr:threonine ammonia-lyase [Oscillospiraceae bacterium]